MQRRAGFTLLEIAISVAILMIITLIAVPSVRGCWLIAACRGRSMR